MKTHKRLLLAFTLASSLALSTLFEQVWRFAAPLLVLLNLPGMLLGLVNGRFFPPEGHPGQSWRHFVAMILAQAVLWFVVICVICAVRGGDESKRIK